MSYDVYTSQDRDYEESISDLLENYKLSPEVQPEINDWYKNVE